MAKMADLYLIFYNLLQFFGWLAILITGRLDLLMWFQTIQMIEVCHCIIGIVKSSAAQTFAQILSRILIVWMALVPFPETRDTIGLNMILWAWPLAETTRYAYYALSLMKLSLYIVTWARYTFFIVLYPLGVSGELLILIRLIQVLIKSDEWNIKLPNPLNISFYAHYSVMMLIACYPVFFPKLYMYMLSQRKKVLGGGSQTSKDSAQNIVRGQRQKSD